MWGPRNGPSEEDEDLSATLPEKQAIERRWRNEGRSPQRRTRRPREWPVHGEEGARIQVFTEPPPEVKQNDRASPVRDPAPARSRIGTRRAWHPLSAASRGGAARRRGSVLFPESVRSSWPKEKSRVPTSWTPMDSHIHVNAHAASGTEARARSAATVPGYGRIDRPDTPSPSAGRALRPHRAEGYDGLSCPSPWP